MNTFLEYLCESKRNTNRIDESSFSRLISRVQNQDYCVVSAYRNPDENTDAENKKRHKILIQELNKRKLGPIELISKFKEEKYGNETIEKSLFFTRPDEMSYEEFEKLAEKLRAWWENAQDSVLVKSNGITFFLYEKGVKENQGKGITLKDGYSKYLKQKHLKRGFSVDAPPPEVVEVG